MEGKVIAHVIARLGKRDSLDPHAIRRIQDSINDFEEIFDGFGFCLSEDGDLLSQWRGYADDGTGVAIGFSTSYLRWLSRMGKRSKDLIFTIEKVEYETAAQESLIEPMYRDLKQCIDDGAYKFPSGRMVLDVCSDEEIEKEKQSIENAYQRLSFALLLLSIKLFCIKDREF